MAKPFLKLPDHWRDLRHSADPLRACLALTGKVYRDMPGRQTEKVSIENQSYFIKKHFGVGLKEIVKNYLCLRKPVVDASNEWHALNRLAELNIKAPQAIAMGHNGAAPYSRQSFIVLEDLADRISIEDIALNHPERLNSIKTKRHWIKTIATIVRKMHAAGINHRDLYLCHFLVDPALMHPQEQDVYLIDFHRAEIHEALPTRWIIKDLAALYFSSWPFTLSIKDKLYFMKHYMNTSVREALRHRLLWTDVNTRAAKMYRSYQKKYPHHDYTAL